MWDGFWDVATPATASPSALIPFRVRRISAGDRSLTVGPAQNCESHGGMNRSHWTKILRPGVGAPQLTWRDDKDICHKHPECDTPVDAPIFDIFMRQSFCACATAEMTTPTAEHLADRTPEPTVAGKKRTRRLTPPVTVFTLMSQPKEVLEDTKFLEMAWK